jgi:hypothetical protein
MPFTRRSTSSPSANPTGQCASATIIVPSANFPATFFFGNGSVRTKITTNDFDPIQLAPVKDKDLKVHLL